MAKKTSLLVLLMLLLAAGAATAAMSGTYYIKKGVTSGDTFASFVAAASAMQSQGLGGNVTFLAFAGVYDEGVVYLQNIAGDTTYTTTFDKVSGQSEVLVTTTSSYAFYIYYNCNVKLRNLSIRGASYGVYSYYSSGVKLEKCRLLGTSYGAMLYYAHYDSVVGCLITGSSVGLYFYGTSSPISKHNHASNNIVTGFSSYAIYSYYNDSLELYDNTFSGAASYTVYANYATRWRIRGNIFKQNGSYIYYFSTGCTLGLSNKNDFYNQSATGILAYYNSIPCTTMTQWRAQGFDSASITSDPLLTGGYNLHLRSGSPCISAGDTIAGITTDFDGDSRTLNWPDIGADEYNAPSPMNGTYTIKQDGTGNYTSFFDAMWDVWGRGFGGGVTFEVYAGTYREQIRLTELYNGNNFLTFKAHVGAAGTDQVIISSGTTYGAWLTHASKVKFIDLIFAGYTSYGAYCQTLTTGTDAYKGNDTLTFRRCIFNGASPIYLYYSSNDDSVVDCQLYATSSYGVYSYSSASYPSTNNVFINNFIVGFTSYGIYSYYNSANKYYYNTIYGPSCTYAAYDYYYSLTAPTFRNNIFYNGNSTTSYYALYLVGSTTPPASALNYNCYYYPAGTNIAYVNGAKTWATLRAGGYEANGINRNPRIGGVSNPHLQTGSPCVDSATNISGVTRDIDQDLRDSLPGAGKYDIGADEYTGAASGPMSGVYTVKQAGGGDFTSIIQAINALEIRGFGGSVQFDVYNGTYTGMYNLSGIANGTTWLTFRVYPGQSATLDAASNIYNWFMQANKRVRIQGFRMTGSASYGIYMYANTSASPYNGCDTCVIVNDTIYAPSGIYTYASDDDTITGNKIVASSSYGMYIYGYSTVGSYTKRNFITNNEMSGYTSYGIMTYYQDSMRIRNNTLTGPGSYSIMSYYGSYDTISNNTLSGSSYGVYANGYSSSPFSRCNVIANNNITSSGYGVYAAYQDTLRIKYNTITNGSGISLNYGNYDSIYNNFINATSSYGLYLYGTSTSPYSVNNVVANNIFRGWTTYGLYMYYQSNPQIVFNTFRGTGSYGVYSTSNYGWKLHDNIFMAATYALYNAVGGDTFPITANNNDYRLNGGGSSVIYHAPSGALTLPSWQSLSLKDTNSINADPLFVSTTNGHLSIASPCINAGRAYAPFTTDIDGESRTVNTPDIGADEVLIDVAARTIFSPTGGYKVGDTIVPSAAFKHVSGGYGASSYYVKMVIARGTTPVYADSVSRTTSPGDSVVVNFARFIPTVADSNYNATCCHLITTDIVPSNDTARSNFTVAPVDVGVYGILAPVGQIWRDRPVNPQVLLRNNGVFPATFNVRFTIDQGSALDGGTSVPGGQAKSQCPTIQSGAGAQVGKAPGQGSTAKGVTSGLVGKTVSQGSTAKGGTSGPVAKTPSQGSTDQGNASVRSDQTLGFGGVAAPTGAVQKPGFTKGGADALVYDTTQTVTLGAGVQQTLTFTKSWTPTVDGDYTGACRVTMAYDRDSTNNYAESTFTVRHIDLGVAALLSPSGTIVEDTVVSPTVVMKSFGTADANCAVRCIIKSGATTVYDTTETGVFLAVGDSVTRTLAKSWAADPLGQYTVTAYTTNPLDIYPTNDTAHASGTVVHIDLGAAAVLAPTDHVVEDTLVHPSIVVKSYGPSDATFDARCIIRNGAVTVYDTIETGIFLAAGDSATRVFTEVWKAGPVGAFTVTAYTLNPYDRNPANDTAFGDGMVTSSAPPGWTELAALPKTPSGKAIRDGGCLAYDAATDVFYASKGNKTGDFYTFDVRAATWTTKSGVPLGAEGKQVYKGSVLCADGNGKLYLTKGNNTAGFWEYDAAQNAWTQKTNVPTGPSHKKVKQGAALAWATTGGVGHVYLLKGYRNEFYKYDPATNAWVQLLNAPIGRLNHVKWDAGSWLLSNPEPGAHLLYAFKAKYHEFYAYDTDADSWLMTPALTPMPTRGTNGNKKAKDGACAAWYNGVIYALKGGNTTEFWRYFPQGDSWRPQPDIPLSGYSGIRRKVKSGAAMAAYPSIAVYVFKGNKSNEFWRFRPLWEAEATPPSRDGVTASTMEMGRVSFAIAPNPLAGGLATVRYNLPKAGLATLNVFDVTGRTVSEQTLATGRTGTASLDLRKLEAGVYMVKVTTDGFGTTQKLVVEH